MPSARERRRVMALLEPFHRPATSWDLAAEDAKHNDGKLADFELRKRVALSVAQAVEELCGITDTRMLLCAPQAMAAARVASELTGNRYRPQSGIWATGYREGGRVVWRSGRGNDFHTWVVAAHPGGALEFFDPQAMFWDPPTMVWDWAPTVHRLAIAWEAFSTTTETVLRRACHGGHVVPDAIYLGAMRRLGHRPTGEAPSWWTPPAAPGRWGAVQDFDLATL